MAQAKQVFNASSPGFLYSVVVGILTLLAIAGVKFPEPADLLAGEIMTTLSSAGIWAVVGVLASSIIFPIYNAVKGGFFTLKGIFASTLTWIAIGNLAISALLLTGLALPPGTVETIIAAVQTKDWIGLGSFLVTSIIPTIVRWIKDRKAEAAK